MTKNGQTYYYHSDRLGTITALTNSTGSLAEEYHYDPFGRPLVLPNSSNTYLFTGRTYDPETELYYYRARYYDPVAGRFINTDPLTWAPNDPRPRGFTGNDPLYMASWNSSDSGIDNLTKDIVFSNLVRDFINRKGALNPSLLNLYTYCANNPVNHIDPLGYERKRPWIVDDGFPPGEGQAVWGRDNPIFHPISIW